LIPTFDGEGQGSWPLSYVATVVVSAVGDSADCSITQELVQFLSWLQINQRAVDRAAAQGWVPLSVAYKKKVIDVLGTIKCDDEQALTTAYVIGEGISRPALVDLASNYNSNSFTQKYFASDVPTVVRDISQGTRVTVMAWSAAPSDRSNRCRSDRLCSGDDRRYARAGPRGGRHHHSCTWLCGVPLLQRAFPTQHTTHTHHTHTHTHTQDTHRALLTFGSIYNRYPSFASSLRHST
jgi:hypothetical protein